MSDQYTPGVCNIGESEIKFRRITQGWGGFVLTIAIFSIIIFFQFSFYVYFLLFLPVIVAVLGFLQAKEKFCVQYARAGVSNMTGHIGETKEIIGQLNRKKDYRKAKSIFIKAALISLTITGLLSIIGPKI